MIKSKYISVIVAVFVIFALMFSAFMMVSASEAEPATTEYEKRLFNGETVVIEIEVDSDDWQSLLDNAQAKEYISADLVINGERFSTVGIRTKGNSSLSQTGSNERYSLQLNPDKYVSGQSFYGLDTMCLNNLMGDASYMKDYLSYDIMEYLGVPSPLRNYARVTVNGEDYGLFLLLERYDDSFLDRVYGSSTGELYNVKMQQGERSAFEAGEWEPQRGEQNGEMPEGMLENSGAFPGMGGDGEWQMPEGFDIGDMEGFPFTQDGEGASAPDESAGADGETGEEQTQQGGMNFGGMGSFSSGGGSLVYTDDDPASYGSIFNNAVSNNVSQNDEQQVIEAIEKLNEGEDLEEYWDVDEILRYLAAHTFVVNLDSYVSSMQQNYYLLERDGVVSILPWDYNLAFGGYNSGSASSVVNFPIDTPVSGVSIEDRPLVDQLLSVDEYRERYHSYLQEIVDGYVNSGLLAAEIDRLDAQISDDVATDATAYYTHDEYKTAIATLEELILLRAESVAGQLSGSIPSTTDGQSENPDALVDAGHINLSDMGSMGGGGGGGFGGGDRAIPSQSNAGSGESDAAQETQQPAVAADAFSAGDTPQQAGDRGSGDAPPDMESFQGQMPDSWSAAFGDSNVESDNASSDALSGGFAATDDTQSTPPGDEPSGDAPSDADQPEADETPTAQQEENGEESQTETETQFGDRGNMGFGGMGESAGGGTPFGNAGSAAGSTALTVADWTIYGAVFVLLAAAISFAALHPKRKWSRTK